MALSDDLREEAFRIFRDEQWRIRHGVVVPESENIALANEGVELDVTILYADIAQSTALVNERSAKFAAEVYKVYLYCAARVVRDQGGVITAYDGDRIMAVFIGDNRSTNATVAALKVNGAVQNIVNPALRSSYPQNAYTVGHCVGVDAGRVLVARTGVRGANDLVWVGRAANHAAKLSSIREVGYSAYITAEVYNDLQEHGRNGGTPRRAMWEQRTWSSTGRIVYRSEWVWSP